MHRFFITPRPQEELAGLAHQLLEKWGALEEYPVEIEHHLESHHGIKVLPSRYMPAVCDSGGAVSMDGTVVYVDPEDYKEARDQYRLRMTIAHEFSHYKLHSKIFSLLKVDQDIADLLKFFTNDESAYATFEIQAFTLAGYLLVPEETISQIAKIVVDELSKTAKRKGGYSLDLKSEAVWSILAKDVARKYEVSHKAAKRRLEWSGLWGKPL